MFTLLTPRLFTLIQNSSVTVLILSRVQKDDVPDPNKDKVVKRSFRDYQNNPRTQK